MSAIQSPAPKPLQPNYPAASPASTNAYMKPGLIGSPAVSNHTEPNNGNNETAEPQGPNQRIDLGAMIEELTSLLGKESWTKYAQIISLFILGKLSRKELSNELELVFSPSAASLEKSNTNHHHSLVRLHNQLLLGIFANSLRENPLGRNGNESSWGFGNGSNNPNNKLKRINKHNSQIEVYKKIVMSLPLNDRNRLKMITKEAGKRGFIFCSVFQARLNNIPKIPIVTNPESLKRVKSNNLKTPLEWSQDIMNGFNVPLASESHSLPDTDSFYLRMVGIAREHGLVGTVDARCVELISLALDQYLKNIIEFTIDTVRYRRKKYSDYYDLNESGLYKSVSEMAADKRDAKIKQLDDDKNEDDCADEAKSINNGNNSSKDDIGDISMSSITKAGEAVNEELHENRTISLTNEDIYDSLSIFPNLVEPSGSYYALTNLGLVNDDELVDMKSNIDDLPDFLNEKPTFTPLDERNVGTRHELNWLIKGILTED
ncbi:BMC_2a_G0053150.mRNA.1.CDS.1 [Saccharomyces cerevisiae]|nr:Hfi1p [Saccharomyces cerevisiae YJM1447]CAI4747385.1 BMC_2a_G0053150.mRNA.1.CDS.1 [Saccharomyces cerevisiae]CAI4754111.1 BMB_G0053120.mRNA.1.CDS.1 [Saccharomyces cerevisiae]CAI7321980.1 BMC_2a_G0053150.mRNA.1.CDS.1 [Saccharomyces cerevisiae]CAI7325022.1 BMB_G0053120.mRNA.1.CDS.1 [Saccharomyces cerevisiae]